MKNGNSIRSKLQKMMLQIVASALILTSIVGIVGMLNIQSRVRQDGEALGVGAAQKSEEALLYQMEQNLLNIIMEKSRYAEAELNKYANFVTLFAQYAQRLYRTPERYTDREVAPPLLENKDVFSMQRYLHDASVPLDSVWEELCLLGNLEDAFAPILEEYKGVFATVYVGTESGFLLSYDAAAHTAYGEDTGYTGEFYYAYKDSAWYTQAKESRGAVFTDTYLDGYGRGLTVTCVSPIYDAQGVFQGAVALDVLIDDLSAAVMDTDISANSHAMLLSPDGKIIASPAIDQNGDKTVNIREDASHPAHPVSQTVLSGKSGIVKTAAGIYYAFAPVAVSGWTIAMHIPQADIIEPVNQIHTDIADATKTTSDSIARSIFLTIAVFLLAFLAVTAIAVVVARKMSRRLAQPLVDLEKDVARISSGELDYRTQVNSDDEIGHLASSFNEMTVSLKKHIDELTSVTAEKERIGAELDVATKIQASMLPCIFPAFPEREEFDVYATMTPAKEVGGDFYDFFMLDQDNLAIVVADVSGKGVPAALFMVIGKTLIKDHTVPGKDLGEVFTEVNQLLCESNSEELFITAFVGVLNLKSGEFRYVNAGHELPYISRRGEPFAPHKIRAAFVLAGMEGMRYKAGVFQLEPGDKIFQYTDGVTEATDPDNRLFGMDRLTESLGRVSHLPPEEILRAVKQDIDSFVAEAPQFDDITMLCLEFKKRSGENEGRIVTPPTLEALTELTEYVEATLEAEAVPMGTVTKMNIALDEIYSNIVHYSGASFARITCGVENGNTAYMIFADDGKPYNPLEKEDPDITLSAEERDIGGLGIFMVKKSMSSVAYEYAGGNNNLTLKLKF